VPLETATFVVSLVVTNPDGTDPKSTADDHIRLIKASLKRTFPLLDGAVSLSHTQLMRLNDLSASVQLQLNDLRDGTATANNAINARYANSASVASNALSLGGFAAAAYPRLTAGNAFTSLNYFAGNDETLRLHGTNPYITWYNASQSTRYGYIQFLAGSVAITHDSGPIDLYGTSIRHNGTNTVWHSGNDGAGSSLDADTVDGYNAAEAATGSTVAARTSSGFLFASYFNQSSGESENPNVNSVFVSNGDGYLRKATPAYLGTQMVTKNISTKSGTAKTISSSAPSGGSDGDIWYQIVS
jgi:hypothetical protein